MAQKKVPTKLKVLVDITGGYENILFKNFKYKKIFSVFKF